MTNEELCELKAKSLCYCCVDEAYLRAEINRKGVVRQCSYCNKMGKSYTVDELAGRIEDAFEQHYTRVTYQPTYWEEALGLAPGGAHVVDAIADVTEMPQEAAEDVQKILEEQHSDFDSMAMGEETEFSSESYYQEKGIGDTVWQQEWIEFEQSLKTEVRFFNRLAEGHLSSLFSKIEAIPTIDGRPLVIDAGPTTSLSTIYRARVFQSDDRLKKALCQPDLELGPPPDRVASAGRMNAHGISVFYGATDAHVAIAEVRPPVGSQVAVAAFEIIRPLRLLDITAFDTVSEHGSVFDPELADRLERAAFLQSLSRRIARPVMPDDAALDYLPTQAITDYLATRSDPPIDGIVFESTQSPVEALNVVLFHKAVRVESISLPKGTEVEASIYQRDEDGREREYVVFERIPSATAAEPPTDHAVRRSTLGIAIKSFDELPPDLDLREPTLRINTELLKVHVVQGVKFHTDECDVRRNRWETSDEPNF